MPGLRSWSSTSALLLVVSTTSSMVAPLVVSAPASAADFSDTRSHWARPFIEALADKQIIAGFSDGTFKPDAPVTRAQFAAIIKNAFNNSQIRVSQGFGDVSGNYWAATAIKRAYETGFMSGYPGNLFKPEQQIPKAQVLVSLSSGLTLTPTRPAATVVSVFRDAATIPDYATNGVAAATERNMVVNYPNVNFLNPNQTATRAEVAAFIYQALVSQGKVAAIAPSEGASNYIVRANGTATNPQNPGTPSRAVTRGTAINVKYLSSKKIVVTRGETINNLSLRTADDVRNSQGEIVIPRDSEIVGQLVPTSGSSSGVSAQFMAQKVTIGNQSYSLNAQSQIVNGQQVDRTSLLGVLKDAAVSAASQAVLATVLKQPIDVQGILTGLAGQATGNVNKADDLSDFLVIDPSTDLRLTLTSDFYGSF